jgi:DNA repair protein RecN (Recombination protein N)
VLVDLTIKNFAIVEDVSLTLEGGFTVLTGETGAGKSILVDALSLLCGGRWSSEMLRSEADRVIVAGRFELSPETARDLEAAGIGASGGELVLRREMGADGRSRAFLNGEPASAKTVARLGEALLVIHGQTEEGRLLEPEAGLDLLDAFAGCQALSAPVVALAGEFQKISAEREELLASRRDRDRRLDLLGYEIREIDEAKLEETDEAELLSERNRLLHADRIRELGETALGSLMEGEGSAADQVGQAYRALAELARIDPAFAEAESGAAEVKSRISELARLAREAAGGLEADPDRLAALETRLEKLSRLKKKYGQSLAHVLEHRREIGEESERLSNIEDSLERLEDRQRELRSRYDKAARELSAARVAAAKQFSAAVQKELVELAMEKARFRVALSERAEEVSPRGREDSDLLFAPNPGEPEGSLSRIASGGELSRAELAVETAAARKRASPHGRTLVFDEVDAGIGGRVAEAVGRKLKALSERDQVLCVTHLPQIAALADRQFVAVKSVERGRTRARVRELTETERVEEIARMLAGEKITSTARQHARALLGSS